MFCNSAAPTVSVVVPLHNKRDYVGRCLQSIQRQTYLSQEVIVVDDGSTDGSGRIAQAYLRDVDRLIAQPNAGVSAARNRGIAEAHGQYVAFLDADDEWHPEFLEATVSLATQFPQAGMLCTGYRMQFPVGQAVEISVAEADRHRTCLIPDYFRRVIAGNIINSSCVMIPRLVFTVVGEFAVGEERGEDLDMWARIALRYPLAYDTRILSTYHQGVSSTARRFNEFPKYSPVVRSLRQALAETSTLSAHSTEIQAYINKTILDGAFDLAKTGNRAAMLQWLDGNKAVDSCPVFARTAPMPGFWSILRIVSYLRRARASRMSLRLRDGAHVSHGVTKRLAVARPAAYQAHV